MKRTVLVGATPNPARYAFTAAGMLAEAGHEIVPLGIKKGQVQGVDILDIRAMPEIQDVHTITMYIGRRHQSDYYNYLLGLNPARIIFNPGTENPEFARLATEKGIEVDEACTLVMLRVGLY